MTLDRRFRFRMGELTKKVRVYEAMEGTHPRNPITIPALCAKTGFTERHVRGVIQHLRMKHLVVHAGHGRGYYRRDYDAKYEWRDPV